MSKSSSDDIINGYIEEVKTYIPVLKQGIQSLKKNPNQPELVQEIHRLVHTVKGASSMVGIYGLSHIAWQLEDTLDELISGKLKFDGNMHQMIAKMISYFEFYCADYLDKGVKAQELLKDAVISCRRVRNLPPEEDESIIKPLLTLVPEIEGGKGKIPEETAQFDESIIPDIPEESEGASEEDMIKSILDTIPEEAPEEVSEVEEEPEKPKVPDIAPMLDVPPELMQSYLEEAEEHLEDLGRSLNIIEKQVARTSVITTDQREVLRQIRRSVHTLKGASAVIGFSNVSSWAHQMEDLLDWLYETAQMISPDIVKTLVDSADLLESIVARPQDPQISKTSTLRARYLEIMKQTPGETKEAPSQLPQPPPEPTEEFEDKLPEPAIEDTADDTAAETAKTPAKTLRVGMERIDELVNLTGELIIALSGFDQKMEALKNTINELELSRARLKEIARDMEHGFEVKSLERMKPGIIRKSVTSAAASDAYLSQYSEFEDFDTLELDRYSELNMIIRTLNEASVDVGAIYSHLVNLYSDFDGHLTRERVLLSELQDKMMRVRMTPMSIITNRLRRTAREVASKLGKKIRLIIEGASIELDRLVWDKLIDPLMHLLRNAADHGIEPPALRQALGKPAIGVIRLTASREGNQVVIRVSDDGSGLNYDAIRATAKSTGLSDRIDDMTEEELTSLIFQPGFSTRGKISEVSGRGVGMDVVKDNIQQLKGTIQISSQKGKGTRFTIRIPLTLAAVRALLFSVSGQLFAIALNEVVEIVRIDKKQLIREPEDAVKIGENIIPIYYLGQILKNASVEESRDAASEQPIVLIVESGERRGAFVVDHLAGQREIVIKSTGSHLRYVKGISGATIMGDGSVVPIINAHEIMLGRTFLTESVKAAESAVIEKPLEIMVVDDSVSIRQVVSRLMEDQGWKVSQAKDGIDALEQLREIRPDLIVLDIEMPRMNGYEFLSAIRTQPAYSQIPVVMLTSRTAGKHRQKALSLGAKGFIVKPYNDEDFVNLVLKLTEK